MARPEIILTTSDLSEKSELALQRAAFFAREHGARLELLHVQEDCVSEGIPKGAESDELCRRLTRHAEEELRRQAEKVIGPGVDVRCRVEAGKDFVVIIRQARMLRADLIVMAAHGSHSIRDRFLGTTPEKVVRKGGGPILTVRQPPTGPYERVLVATDFSNASWEALLTAQILAPQAQFHFLHVFELWGHGRLPLAGGDQEALARYHHQARAQAEKMMDEFLLGITPGQSERHIRHGHAPTVILSLAEELGVDLVVTGTEGRSGLPHILVGSVAEHVLREARCDVLTVRLPNYRFELP
jgi:nucleotide-binding universal stress UspA family protein